MTRAKLARWALSVAAILISITGPAAAEDRVTLLLNWVPQGDHSPYYYAMQKGWYAQAGVALTIEGGRGSAATIQRVAAGQVGLGIADMSNVIPARANGADVVGVMAIYANTPIGLYWKLSSGIKVPKNLAGHRAGAPAGDAVRAMWPAIAARIGIPANSVSWVNIAPEAKVASLQSDAIDFTAHFFTVHDIYERTFGADLGYVGLRQLGVNPYGLAIISSPAYLRANGDAVRRFMHVTQRAFAACLAEPQPCTRSLADATSQDPGDVLINWRRAESLIGDETSRQGTLGAFEPERVQSDVRMLEDAFTIKVPDAARTTTNDYLDPAIHLPAPR